MLEIMSRAGQYRVVEAPSLREAVAESAREAGSGAFFLVDARVHELYPEAFEDADADRVIAVGASEDAKSLHSLETILLPLLRAGIRRNSRLVVVGVGSIQDIGCFIASTLFRGIAWSLVPTTLLAQCDSCIGSKSSINVGTFKNQLGTFYPPRSVWVAFDVLRSLPHDEVRSGLGEIIKLHLVAGQAEFCWARDRLTTYAPDNSGLPELVWSSLVIKKGFIEEDEFDTGRRNLLNYGHTFGHAFESVTAYAIPHGIAVLLGVAAATYFSERLGMVSEGSYRELNELLRPWYAPYQEKLTKADIEPVLRAMKQDKKNTGDRITFILTRGPGAMEKVSLDLAQQVRGLLTDFLCRE
jgi:3-dehydroquinate synthase